MVWLDRAKAFFKKICDDLGIWIWSLIFNIAIPVLPVSIDIVKHRFAPGFFQQVQLSSLLITAILMSATYGVTAKHLLIRSFYILNLAVSFVFYSIPVSEILRDDLHYVKVFAGFLILGAALVHSAERFWWHVYMNNTFPENGLKPKRRGRNQ